MRRVVLVIVLFALALPYAGAHPGAGVVTLAKPAVDVESDSAITPIAKLPLDAATTPLRNPSPTLAPHELLGWGEPANRVRASSIDGPTNETDYENQYWITTRCTSDLLFPVAGCPIRVIDGLDFLGNPSLTMDPTNPERMAFTSLHANYNPGDGPSRLSRNSAYSRGQLHTTFVSVDGGACWSDNPYVAPAEIRPPFGDGFGEDNHGLIDGFGQLYVATHYARRAGGNEKYEHHIATWKFDATLGDLCNGPVGVSAGVVGFDYAQVNQIFATREVGNPITGSWVLDVCPPKPIDPNSTGLLDDLLCENPNLEFVGLLWHEQGWNNKTAQFPAMDGSSATRNLTSWVTGAITTKELFTNWTRLPDKMAIGPCITTTNPVTYIDRRAASNQRSDASKVYIGCVADWGFDAIPNVKRGEIVLFEMDLIKGVSKPIRKTTLEGGEPILTASPEGYLVLMTVKVEPPTAPESANATGTSSPTSPGGAGPPGENETDPRDALNNVTSVQMVRSGDFGRTWSRMFDLGPDFHNATLDVDEAQINAVLYRPKSETVHVIYLERAGDQDYEQYEEDRVWNESAKQPEMWRKTFFAIDCVGNVVEEIPLDIRYKGDADRLFGGSFGRPDDKSGLGDTRDTLNDVNGHEWIAFNDLGIVSVMELVENDNRTYLCPPGPDVPIPAQQVPSVATPAVAPTIVTATIPAGVISAAVAGEGIRRLASRRAMLRAGGRK